MKNSYEYIKLGRVIAKRDFISCITVDPDHKEMTFDIVFAFKNGHVETALKFKTHEEAEACMKKVFEILLDFPFNEEKKKL